MYIVHHLAYKSYTNLLFSVKEKMYCIYLGWKKISSLQKGNGQTILKLKPNLKPTLLSPNLFQTDLKIGEKLSSCRLFGDPKAIIKEIFLITFSICVQDGLVFSSLAKWREEKKYIWLPVLQKLKEERSLFCKASSACFCFLKFLFYPDGIFSFGFCHYPILLEFHTGDNLLVATIPSLLMHAVLLP